MPSESDLLLAALLMEGRFLRAEDLVGLLRAERAQPGISLGDRIRARGSLAPQQIAEVEHRVREAFAAAAETTIGADAGAGRSDPTVVVRIASATGAAGSCAAAPAAPSETAAGARRLGRYRLFEELGRGGMGVVYRALDTELKREVAIKTLSLDGGANSTHVERLQREAQTAGALNHPGIVPIHDAGTLDGVPFLAMGFVRGRTISRALVGCAASLRERVRWVAEAAEAVAHAHEQQVIHRDLKPSNLMIDDEGRIQVLDFGLARKLESESALTRSGEAVGTPLYMAPEQMSGVRAAVGPQADVYSLGAVLFEVLAGRPPFPGDTMGEVVAKVLTEEAPSLRRLDPRIPADLETICARALRKDPEHRFPSAREFAAELGRWRDGEAIHSRPETTAERLWRWGRRRKASLSVGSAAVLCIAFALVSAWREKAGRRERESLEARVTTALRERAATLLEATLVVRRSGGVLAEAERAFLAPLQAAVAEAVARLPVSPEPHYRLGRMYRALLRFEEASEQQTQALAKDPDHAPSLYERAVLTAHAYRVRAASLRAQAAARESLRRAAGGRKAADPVVQGVADGESAAGFERLRATLRADLDRLARVVASTDSNGSAGADVEDQARLAAAQGLAAAFSGSPADSDAARGHLERALSLVDTLEEAYETLADLALLRDDLDAAEQTCARGLRHDRGYVPFSLVRGEVRLRRALDPTTTLEDSIAVLRDAASDLRRAAELAPDSGRAHLAQARALTELGRHRAAGGEDPTHDFVEARDAASRAIRVSAGDATAWFSRAYAWFEAANSVEEAGGDPEEAYRHCVADYTDGLRLEPDSLIGRIGRGMARANWALFRTESGGTPTSLQEEAIQDFTHVARIAPDELEAWKFLGIVHGNRAVESYERGEDPGPSFRAAEECYLRACDLQPVAERPWEELATSRLAQALARRGQGSVVEVLQRAILAFEEARKAMPQTASVDEGRGHALILLGEERLSEGDRAGAAESFTGAIGDLSELLEYAPPVTDAMVLRARARVGRAEAISDLDEQEALREGARADLDRVLALDERHAEALDRRARLHMSLGRWQEAVDDFDAVARLDPEISEEGREIHADALIEAARREAVGLAGARTSGEAGADADCAAVRDRIFERLGRALSLRPKGGTGIATDASWVPLHGDPRWADVLRRCENRGD